MSLTSNEQGPQFSTAEYESTPEDNQCGTCQQPITGQYFRVSGERTCAACAQKLAGELPKDSGAAFGRALLFGAGASFLGLILYSAVGIITGLEIGFVSLAVGWLVGKGMMKGSRGIGGRKYQVAALAFTYVAVSLSAIPVAIYMFMRDGMPSSARQVSSSSTTAPKTPSDAKSGDAKNDDPKVEITFQSAPEPAPSLLSVLGTLLFLGLAAPFLAFQNPGSGILGLIILAVGLQIAWKIAEGQKIEVLGPFNA